MPRPRFATLPSLAVLSFSLPLAVGACGGQDEPPPKTAATATTAAPAHVRGEAAPTGGTTASMGDSALAPAADDAAKSEDWPRAEALFRELSRRQPRNAGAKRGLGVALT